MFNDSLSPQFLYEIPPPQTHRDGESFIFKMSDENTKASVYMFLVVFSTAVLAYVTKDISHILRM